jgi:hypothetical protein
VLCNGRRWGKNILLQDFTVEAALAQRHPCAWATPSYKMLSDDWRMLTDLLAPATEHRSEQEKQIRLIGGGVLDMWSLDNPDAIRGRKYARFIVNEAAFVPDLMHDWNMVIRPTLIDLQGDAYFSGTPKGQNGLWQLFNQTGADWMRWQMSSYSNPHIPKSELDALKETMTERAFQQEILGQFLEDGGGVFRRVQAAAIATRQEAGIKGHQYVIGADWGRSNDATVFAVLDITVHACVYVDRMTNTDYASQRIRLIALAERFNHAAVLVETNSIGMPQLEELQRMGLSVNGFQTTNATKAQIIDGLALAFEQSTISIINDLVMVSEIMAYQSERLPSGLLRYGAPEGMHDDTVIALALAWAAGSGPSASQMVDFAPSEESERSPAERAIEIQHQSAGRVCPQCGKSEFVHLTASGAYACAMCGIAVSETTEVT